MAAIRRAAQAPSGATVNSADTSNGRFLALGLRRVSSLLRHSAGLLVGIEFVIARAPESGSLYGAV